MNYARQFQNSSRKHPPPPSPIPGKAPSKPQAFKKMVKYPAQQSLFNKNKCFGSIKLHKTTGTQTKQNIVHLLCFILHPTYHLYYRGCLLFLNSFCVWPSPSPHSLPDFLPLPV